jgi:hypothetical protein
MKRQLNPLAPGQGERKRELWTRDFEGKFVKWEGTLLTVDADSGRVTIAHTKGGKTADVQVDFRDDRKDDLRGLIVDQKIVYSARLVDFGKDGYAFTLSDGLVEQ